MWKYARETANAQVLHLPGPKWNGEADYGGEKNKQRSSI